AVLRPRPVSAAGALPRGAHPSDADAGGAGVRRGAGRGVLGGPAVDHRLVLPPGQRAGAGRARLVRAGGDAGRVRLLAAARRLLPVLGARAADVVHLAGRGHAVRVSAARFRRPGEQVLGLVRPGVAVRAAGRGGGDRGGRGGGDGPVLGAGAAGVPVGGGAATGLRVPEGAAHGRLTRRPRRAGIRAPGSVRPRG